MFTEYCVLRKDTIAGAFANGVISTYDVGGASECESTCFYRPDCMKATYISNTKKCTLHDSSAGAASNSQATRWLKECSTKSGS